LFPAPSLAYQSVHIAFPFPIISTDSFTTKAPLLLSRSHQNGNEEIENNLSYDPENGEKHKSTDNEKGSIIPPEF
jgi:hypothetical protein